MKIEKDKIIQAARNAVPLTIKTFTLPHETEEQLEEILEIFLAEMGQEALKDPLFYCLRELAVNAKKANTKRVYFSDKNLELNNEHDYAQGMRAFKQETLDNIDYYLQKQKEQGLYIKIIFHSQGDVLHLFIANNSAMTQKEQVRVYDRIARSRAFSSMEEALATVLDDSEGAGLGLVILVLMLKKLGLNEDAFDIDVENSETIARLSIPMHDVKKDNIFAISKEIINYIEALPQFPENVAELQHMLGDKDVEMSDISRRIATDPALTADLLKLVNSAKFMLPKKVDNIHEAVMLVGMRGLKNLLYSYGTQKVLGMENEKTRVLWQHSYRTAFYSYSIGKNILRNKAILDEVYIGGILHDMGKIAFSAVHPDLIKNIESFCVEKGIPRTLFEDMSAGLSHAELGAMIAEKWNFPDVLVDTIRCHHNPINARDSNKVIAHTVYLANSLANFEEKIIGFEQVDPAILKDFGIRNEEQFASIQQRLSQSFQQESQRNN